MNFVNTNKMVVSSDPSDLWLTIYKKFPDYKDINVVLDFAYH